MTMNEELLQCLRRIRDLIAPYLVDHVVFDDDCDPQLIFAIGEIAGITDRVLNSPERKP